ncbi:hypothetical protein, partial [Bacteroides thetaiotaomicron]
NITGKSIVFETFTNNMDESDALLAIWSLEKDPKSISKTLKQKIVKQTRSILGARGLAIIKLIMNRK